MLKENNTHPTAVVLLSGGLDSATTLAIAKQANYRCYALSFDYDQRHRSELTAAKKIATTLGVVEQRMIKLGLGALGGSALTDLCIDVPTQMQTGIPVTYVPARNTLFLAYALAWAEVICAQHIFIGVNAVDYSGYPDCRPEFIHAFEQMAQLATKAGVEGNKLHIHTPLIHLTKAEIIRRGYSLGIDYQMTVSCYAADQQGRACGQCDSCRLRKKGFQEAGITDPTLYQNSF